MNLKFRAVIHGPSLTHHWPIKPKRVAHLTYVIVSNYICNYVIEFLQNPTQKVTKPKLG